MKGLSDSVKQNLEVSCSLSGKAPKRTLTVNFRSRIEEITQRLGAIELSETEDTDGVDLFGWTSQAIDKRDELEDTLQKESLTAGSARDTIASLQAQLADLIKAKDEHEDDLMANFAELLNEKKTELRRRARQMGTAKVNKKKLEQLEEEGLSAKQQASRGRKRQAHDDDSESEGFEDRMEVDRGQQEEDEDDRKRNGSRSTSRASDTDSDNDDDLDQPVTSQTEVANTTSSKPLSKSKEPEPMPPQRELPFERKSKEQRKEPSPKLQSPEDEDTATEDDEL